ncbi:InlB B-repeat-containing protein [Bifidobacterium vespertilionis]|uniref:InlB B-repeat-containing protein n=1 Tax=Bifidobacterium vespertilionis TaxID=2562524 RepID=UPI001BDBEE4E|nr:InlB B-repeat-containing protein [Bifidobacterium vespertilionis]MBT1179628.1 InlB B-repeat-containing protein [Bifidobacterium vespertilionis]
MTGNNKFWRASLAGLASVAMLATMGVAASTANAATSEEVSYAAGVADDASRQFKVYIYRTDTPQDSPTTITPATFLTRNYGTVVDLSTFGDVIYGADSNKTLAGYSYDLAGKYPAPTNFPVTGDVKLYAQYKEAVKVTFDLNNDGADATDPSVKIAKGDALTAADYKKAADENAADSLRTDADGNVEDLPVAYGAPTGTQFVGWTYTRTASASTDDLYEGAAINENTTLYPRFDKGQNIATVGFRKLGQTETKVRYTLDEHAFPEYRVPQSVKEGQKGTWDYDFKTPIDGQKNIGNTADDLDRTVVFTPADASAKNVTVHFDVTTNGAPAQNNTGSDTVTTSDQKIDAPADPSWAGHVFTGWYLPRIDGRSVKYDFSKTIEENFKDATGNVTLYAGWDSDHVSRLQFNLNYQKAAGARLVWYVYPGSKVELPAGLEDYYETQAQADTPSKSDYTAAKLLGWKLNGVDTVTSLIAPAAKSGVELDAVWSTNVSYRLDANGGKFGNDTIKWVDADLDASSVSFPAPTREGFIFAGWALDTDPLQYVLNVANKKFYKYDASKQGFFDINSKPATTPAGTGEYELYPGAHLVALWVANSVDVTEATYNFNGVLKYESLEQDYASVEQAGYTKDSAKAFVDAMYALRGDYAAYKSLANGSQAKIDAAAKLAPKYADAQKLLVKSDVPVQPEVEKVAVYRLYNPGLAQVAQHLYTTNVDEYNRLQQSEGWKGEGIVFYTTSDKTAAPVYRLYNQYTSEHFLTSDKAEYEDLYQNKGWTNEGVAWYIPSDGTADLYRLQNPVSFEHLYTTNAAEKDNLTANAGWVLEGAPYKVYAK